MKGPINTLPTNPRDDGYADDAEYLRGTSLDQAIADACDRLTDIEERYFSDIEHTERFQRPPDRTYFQALADELRVTLATIEARAKEESEYDEQRRTGNGL